MAAAAPVGIEIYDRGGLSEGEQEDMEVGLAGFGDFISCLMRDVGLMLILVSQSFKSVLCMYELCVLRPPSQSNAFHCDLSLVGIPGH